MIAGGMMMLLILENVRLMHRVSSTARRMMLRCHRATMHVAVTLKLWRRSQRRLIVLTIS